MRLTAKHTLYGCYFGYITQAAVNNLPALLFVTFNRQFGISLDQISLLIVLNFSVQLAVDFIAPLIIRRIGYRTALLTAFGFTCLGMCLLGLLPSVTVAPYLGILTAILLNAIGGGLLEVLISPVVEALPGERKASRMSMLHSFYCWGHMAVVLLSTLYFSTVGIDHWKWLPVLWALCPLLNILIFTAVPIYTVQGDGQDETPAPVVKTRLFWLLFALMICAGASEQAISQWSSLFAETGLQVSKTLGDLLGPCAFAACMGASRLLYGFFGERLRLGLALTGSALLCVAGYLMTALSPVALLSLVGCGICGFSVGLMWPGIFSVAGALCRGGGTTMYALLALAGDLGCAAGPAAVGLVSSGAQSMNTGILLSAVFPIFMVLCLLALRARGRRI